jgi:hypothetical protein
MLLKKWLDFFAERRRFETKQIETTKRLPSITGAIIPLFLEQAEYAFSPLKAGFLLSRGVSNRFQRCHDR